VPSLYVLIARTHNEGRTEASDPDTRDDEAGDRALVPEFAEA
jgi:hypothetical protein